VGAALGHRQQTHLRKAACSPRLLAGRPNATALAGVSGTKVVPSGLSTRKPRYHAPLISGVASGPAVR
jgi:hypothetical protein